MLKELLKDKNIILASGSPRRQQFFRDLGINFEIRLKDIEEVYPPKLKHFEISDYLAQLKSLPFEKELKVNDILITSDTIVWHNEKALGKPRNKEEAFEMLSSMSNQTHEVITSVCFKTTEFQNFVDDLFLKRNEKEEESLFGINKLNIKRSSIPAVTHVDGTARVQIVKKDCESVIRQILEQWYEKTGCPMLLNTSLNVKGMPMVNNWADAEEFMRIYNVKVF